jgi:hypothetical protein
VQRDLASIEVYVECIEPAARSYFDQLLTRIRETWPDSLDTPDGQQARKSSPRTIRVPKHPKVLHRWQLTWMRVKPEWNKGRSYEHIAEWLRKMHEDLWCSPETLVDIIRAGAAGMLDD